MDDYTHEKFARRNMRNVKIRITTWTTFFYDSFRVELKTKKKAKTTDNRATARLVFRSQMVKTFYRLRLYLQRTTKFVATVHNTLNTLPVCEIRFGQLTGKFKNYIRARGKTLIHTIQGN